MFVNLLKFEARELFSKVAIIIGGCLGLVLLMHIATILSEPYYEIHIIILMLKYLGSLLVFMAIMYSVLGLCVVNFYKTLFGNEGYLYFSLPAKNVDHLHAKMIVGVVATILSTIIGCAVYSYGFLSMMDMPGMEMSSSFTYAIEMQGTFSVFSFLFDMFASELGVSSFTLGLYFIVTFILSTALGITSIFASICIGQRFTNRILAAVLAYIVISFAMGILTMIFLGVVPFVFGYLGNDTMLMIHTFGVLALVLLALANYVFYMICRNGVTKNLNLA